MIWLVNMRQYVADGVHWIGNCHTADVSRPPEVPHTIHSILPAIGTHAGGLPRASPCASRLVFVHLALPRLEVYSLLQISHGHLHAHRGCNELDVHLKKLR